MTYYKAQPEDISDLTELRMEYLAADHGEIPENIMYVIQSELPGYFLSHLNDDLFAFLCREGDTAAGCCFLYVSEKPPSPSFLKGKTGTVMNVYTRPQFRNKGIASALMKMLLDEAAKKELDFVELKATEDGYSLYKKLGFSDTVSKYHSMKFIIDKRNDN